MCPSKVNSVAPKTKGQSMNTETNTSLSGLVRMLDEMVSSRPEIMPSKYWVELNRKNIDQLLHRGYDNFKRTIALNYFTWSDPNSSSQADYLKSHLPLHVSTNCAFRSRLAPCHEYMTRRQSKGYNLLTYLLWEYMSRRDRFNLLQTIQEPLEGNPPRIYRRGMLISQDLANSILEYNSIMDPALDASKFTSIMELGAGYGRNAYVFRKALPHVRYIVVDIPPALWVAQKYLSSQFPSDRIFYYQEFSDFSEVSDSLKNSKLAFLLPKQLDLLPDDYVDMLVNISSLHEMRFDQIEYYFGCIDRIVKRYFYMKAWKVSKIPYDDIEVRELDYPARSNWKELFRRECPVQIPGIRLGCS